MDVNLKEKYTRARAKIRELTNKELMQACIEAMEIQNGHYLKELKAEIRQRNIYN